MYSLEPGRRSGSKGFPDPAASLYLAFAGMLMAGLDGIEEQDQSGEPAEKDLYDLEAKEAAKIRTMPGSLDEALNHLRRTINFLLGGVFRTSSRLDRVQADQRSRYHAVWAASVRVFLYYDV